MENIEELEKTAIEAAINSQWDKAIEMNKKILKMDKNNLDALLRLGYAFFQSNDWENAEKIYKKVLKIQNVNSAAQEFLEKIKILKEKKITRYQKTTLVIDPNLFLEVPGRTTTVELINLGQKNILAQLNISQKMIFKIRRRKVEVRTEKNQYVGSLPDDLSHRLILFIKAKSEYSCYIKEITLKKVVVFIKEEKKGSRVKNFISFPKNLQSNIQPLKDTESEVDQEEEELEIENEVEELAETLDDNKDYFSFDLPVDREENEEE